MKRLLHILRVNQWYKNLLVFLPIVFGQQLFNTIAFQKTLLGFVALCLASSAGYVFNDIIDRKKDIYHPEFRKKYIAKKILRVDLAFIFASLLFVLAVVIGAFLSQAFLYFVVGLFALTVIYSLWLKNEVFVDVITISINFVLRAVSGAFVIAVGLKPYIWISPWLLICTFLLALFIAVGKRNSELIVLGKKAAKYKAVLREYTPKLTSSLLTITTSALLVSYVLYTFQSINTMLVFTAPFAVYVMFRYLYLVYSGSIIPISPGKFYKDERLLIGALLWIASVIGIIYFL